MADPRGFLRFQRESATRRSIKVRVKDWHEVYEPFPDEHLQAQAARCMDCGIPFCHQGCPLGNLIPEWNDLVYRDDWREASERLHATNNFPEFTGRLCPAPCEAACVLGINSDPVTIELVEKAIAEHAFEEGWIVPVAPAGETGKSVAVVGSGPAGLAAAQQLRRAGHRVVVFERADRIGGLLRYGIPEFKMEKKVLQRRLDQMQAEGCEFRTSTEVGVDLPADELRAQFDAMVLAGGATVARDLAIEGRDLGGIHQAMEYLPPSNRVQEGDSAISPISAEGRRVVIIGGGDTGADCLGTARRQGAISIAQLEIMARPPESRDPSTPWPTWPLMFRVSSAHEEGCDRLFGVNTERFLGDSSGRVRGLQVHSVSVSMQSGRPNFAKVDGSEAVMEADMVLLAMGFAGAERSSMLHQLGLAVNERHNVPRDNAWMTPLEGVFVCGDMGRGQSLIVWAIAEGRSAAAAVDRYLMGCTYLPEPVTPDATALV